MTTEFFFILLDLVGTFVFALSGAEAAKERELDLFGIIIVAFLTACGGGIIRDVCIDITPPIGLSYWPYLTLTFLASITVIVFHKYILKLNFPVLLFDALGLAMFSVAGTQKTLQLGFNYEVAILLGTLSAIGGGIIRDILLGKIPVVLRKEVYGSAALLASVIVALTHYFNGDATLGAWGGIITCFSIRYFSLRNRWNLPKF